MALLPEIWNWMKTAPLPVVLALNLMLGGWVYAISDEQTQQKAEKAADQKVQADRDKKIEKMDEKLDKLLQAVLEIQAEKKAKAEAEAKKGNRSR